MPRQKPPCFRLMLSYKCRYRFTLFFLLTILEESKTTRSCCGIQSDCISFRFYWQMAVDQAQMQNFNSMFLPAVESVNPCLILIVRRENIVGDTMEVLRKSKNVDYKKPLKVKAAKICTYNKYSGKIHFRSCTFN